MDIVGELESFLLSDLALHLETFKQTFDPREDLIATGVIDSLGILKIASFIEKKFGIVITDDDIVPENFRNIASMKKLIDARLSVAELR